MQLQQVNKGILPLLLILGLLKITGLDAVENQKNKPDISTDYDEEESIEPEGPSKTPPVYPHFDKGEVIVHATHEGENVTLNCQPQDFNDATNVIMWNQNGKTLNNGDTLLGPSSEFALDTMHKLIVLNYNKTTPYNFTCRVEPGHATQNMTIVFQPPDNMSEHNGAAKQNTYNWANFLQITAMTLVLLMTASAWN